MNVQSNNNVDKRKVFFSFLPIPRRTINFLKEDVATLFAWILRGKVSCGNDTTKFEQEFSGYVGSKFAIAVSSGRLGLLAILQSLDLEKNSEIIIPAYTDESVPSIITGLGYKPVFVDIHSETQNIHEEGIEDAITEKTKAIIATHIFGRPCNIQKISAISEKFGLILIEDCAHAIGTKWKNRQVGTFSTASYFSFGLTKPFATLGGGMVITDNESIAKRLRATISTWLLPKKAFLVKRILIHFILSFLTSPFGFSLFTYPLLLIYSGLSKSPIGAYRSTFRKNILSGVKLTKYTDIQARMGNFRLGRIEKEISERVKKAEALNELLGSKIQRLGKLSQGFSNYYFYIIVSKNIDEISKKLLRNGIDTGKNLMRNCARLYSEPEGLYPNTNIAEQFSLQIPLHPKVKDVHLKKIAQVIQNLEKEGKI